MLRNIWQFFFAAIITAATVCVSSRAAFSADPPTAGDLLQKCGVHVARNAPPNRRLAEFETILAREGGRSATMKFDCADGYSLVATGDTRAIALAVKLLPFSDAGSTEDLLSSLARALGRSPEAVLVYFREIPGGHADQFCVPFISDELPLRPELENLRRTENALLRVRRADLQEAKQTCLNEIRGVEASLQESLRDGHI